MLYEMEDAKMFSDCNAGYIYMRKLYSTIGLIGYCEAAQFLGLSVSNNKEYKDFLKLVFGTVKEENKKTLSTIVKDHSCLIVKPSLGKD